MMVVMYLVPHNHLKSSSKGRPATKCLKKYPGICVGGFLIFPMQLLFIRNFEIVDQISAPLQHKWVMHDFTQRSSLGLWGQISGQSSWRRVKKSLRYVQSACFLNIGLDEFH